MSDQKQQLIDSLTSHIDKESEEYLHAHQYLEKTIDSENEFLEDSLNASKEGGKKRYVTLAAILGAIITLVYLTVTHPYFESGNVTELVSNIILEEDESLVPEYVSEGDAFLFAGDRSKPTDNERLKAVWDAHESEARYYMRYAVAYFDDNGSFPTGFVEVGNKLDPKNGYYALQLACILGKKGLTPTYSSSGSRYTINDQSAIDDALQMIDKASEYEKLHSWYLENATEMHRIIYSPPSDYINSFKPYIYLYSVSFSNKLNLISLADVIIVEAERCEKDKDALALRKLVKAWKQVLVLLADDCHNILDCLVWKAMAASPAEAIIAAASACDIEDEIAPFDKIHEKEEIQSAKEDKEFESGIENSTRGVDYDRHASLGKVAMAPLNRFLEDPITLTEEQIKPLRLAEHSLLKRFLVGIGAVILFLAGLFIFLARFSASMNVRALTPYLKNVLGWKDWSFIIALGILTPLVLYHAVIYLSPWSPQDWNFSIFHYIKASGPYLVMIIQILLGITLVTQWRLHRKLPQVIGRVALVDWLAIVCSLASYVLLAHLPHDYREHGLVENVMYGVISYPLFLLVIRGLVAVFSSRKSPFSSSLMRKAIMPFIAIAIIVLSIFPSLYSIEEKYWVGKDTIMFLQPEGRGISPFEEMVTIQRQKEIKEEVESW